MSTAEVGQAANAPVLVSPKAGAEVVAGTVVPIVWRGLQGGLVCPRGMVSEQEIFLSVDGGKTFPYRLTQQLKRPFKPLAAATFQWRVPNLPTDEAVLNLRYGCQASAATCLAIGEVEGQSPQLRSQFRIVAAPGPIEEVTGLVVSAPAKARPGDLVKLTWNSSVTSVSGYAVLASHDGGGRFETLGHASDTSFEHVLPADSAFCRYLYKIRATRHDGSSVESLLRISDAVYVSQ
jgi:hypothetical protein